MFIEPLKNRAEWIAMEFYPERLPPGASLNLTQIKTPVEDALKIAEDKGGKVARLAIGNHCEIYASIVAGRRDNDWLISYSSDQDTPVFRIQVDEKTGTYQVVGGGSE